MFAPRFELSPPISKDLMAIEGSRQAVSGLPVDVAMLASLRETARLVSTHLSTQIEGNRLTQAEVSEALAGARFPGRERDEEEVRNYYAALEEAERSAQEPGDISEELIQRIHGLVLTGKAKPTPYREGQNVIRDGASGDIVYLPPESVDVPRLMADLTAWINEQLSTGELPVPILAGLAHYQFATIHPYFDGNGRTARLLTTLLLHKTGYGLKGLYSLEEYYARNLGVYYEALAIGPSHNYYLGREEADVTDFLAYFCRGMADSFSAVRARAEEAATRGSRDISPLLRSLDPRRRAVLDLFREQGSATTAQIAAHLGLKPRTLTVLCREWVRDGFLVLHDPSRKNRSYRLAPAIEESLLEPGG